MPETSSTKRIDVQFKIDPEGTSDARKESLRKFLEVLCSVQSEIIAEIHGLIFAAESIPPEVNSPFTSFHLALEFNPEPDSPFNNELIERINGALRNRIGANELAIRSGVSNLISQVNFYTSLGSSTYYWGYFRDESK